MSKVLSIRLSEDQHNQLTQTEGTNKEIVVNALNQFFNPKDTDCFNCKFKALCDIMDTYLEKGE